MKQGMIFSFIFYLAFASAMDMPGDDECLNIFVQSLSPTFFIGGEALAQENPDDTGSAKNYFLRSAVFVVGIALLWFVFYKLVYPFLRKYYSAGYSQTLFWSMFLLYCLAWMTISTYVIFEVGFHYHWLKWVFVFIGAIWLIWLLVILLKKGDQAYS